MIAIESKLRLQRNFLVGIAILQLLVELPLALKLYNQEKIVVMVPTIDRELTVGTQYVSEDYLQLRAVQIIQLFFSMRQETISYVTEQLLKQVDSVSYTDFKDQLQILGEDIKARGYRYLFTDIKRFEIDNQNLTVVIEGYLETYLADRQIDKKFKKYVLTFSNNAGLVKLQAFAEGGQDE